MFFNQIASIQYLFSFKRVLESIKSFNWIYTQAEATVTQCEGLKPQIS